MESVWGILKVQYWTGLMILTEPASEMKGIFALSTSGITARVDPEVDPPTIMSTLSFWINRLAKPTDFLGLPPSS